MKLIKSFTGVPKGQIYPVEFQAGDECPPELEVAAIQSGALEQEKPKAAKKEK